MQLSELTVRGFADLLGSDAPAPGGGSAAALHNNSEQCNKYRFWDI